MAANAAKAKTAKAKAVKPKTKRVKAMKTPAAKEEDMDMEDTESQTFSCDDMEEDSRTMIKIQKAQGTETDLLVSREESWETQESSHVMGGPSLEAPCWPPPTLCTNR